MDPYDYDLLGLYWNGAFVDTCVPFGARHRTSDSVHYLMRGRGYDVVNYIDDFWGFGMLSVTRASFDTLRDIMCQLGVTASQKKLVQLATQAMCLGFLVETVEGTVSIPPSVFGNISHWTRTGVPSSPIVLKNVSGTPCISFHIALPLLLGFGELSHIKSYTKKNNH